MITNNAVHGEDNDFELIDDEGLKCEPSYVREACVNSSSSTRSGNNSMSWQTNRTMASVDMGRYTRERVNGLNNNPNSLARCYFDMGLRYLLGYQHQEAEKYFLKCHHVAPDCALVCALIALCHAPNYNFSGEVYYTSTNHTGAYKLTTLDRCDDDDNVKCNDDTTAPTTSSHDDDNSIDRSIPFPSQQVANYYSSKAISALCDNGSSKSQITKDENMKINKKENEDDIKKVKAPNHEVNKHKSNHTFKKEEMIIRAIRILTCYPGVLASEHKQKVSKPFVNEMRKAYRNFSNDPEICYWYAEGLLILNAWDLYDHRTDRPKSPEVIEAQEVLETSLKKFPRHVGLCHLYVHLCEMTTTPWKALQACTALRYDCPDAGHLMHMATHIDVLIGAYESCVKFNLKAVEADRKHIEISPKEHGVLSFYYGYVAHNYHMLIYGCILGGYEKEAYNKALRLNKDLSQELFEEHPQLVSYLESYSAMEVHVLVRFGRWEDILELELPKREHWSLRIYRAGSIRYARALAYAVLARRQNQSCEMQQRQQRRDFILKAKMEAEYFEVLRRDPDASNRILHNNTVDRLLEVDAAMMHGEISYAEGNYERAFELLRKAVHLQDSLNFDDPWGKMQPVRHALGGLLLERGKITEAYAVFSEDLKIHPKNPWGMVGLLRCIRLKLDTFDRISINEQTPDYKEERNTGKNIPRNFNKSYTVSGESVANLNKLKKHMQRQKEELLLAIAEQKSCKWADFEVSASCACCLST